MFESWMGKFGVYMSFLSALCVPQAICQWGTTELLQCEIVWYFVF